MLKSFPHPAYWFLILAMIAFSPVKAQNVIDGVWLGSIRQERTPTPTDFKVRLELKQVGDKIEGRTYIHVAEAPEYRATMSLRGHLYGAMFVFEETHFISQYHPFDWEWCLKSGRMILLREGQYWRLRGRIDGKIGETECVSSDGVFERMDPVGRPAVAKTNPQPVNADTQVVFVPKPPDKPVTTRPAVSPKAENGALAGRKIDHQRDIIVYTKDLELFVWDADKEDGDVVSLSYNNQWILQNHTLIKAKKGFKVKVEPGKDNLLILFAENEGMSPPNTAAVTFFDGQTTRNLNLSSTKSTCGALRFKYQPKP